MDRLFEAEGVRAAINLIRGADQVVELRILDGSRGSSNWPATWSGYFDDSDKLVAALKEMRAATGIYITVNPVNPALLGRSNNRLRKAGKGSSTNDVNVLSRR